MTTSQIRLNILQDLAVKLHYSLHSSANENIISSLLTASLNESVHFRKWFLDRSGIHGQYSAAKFYAEANIHLPEALRGAKDRQGRYGRPDLFLIHKGSYRDWESLHDAEQRDEWPSACRSLRSVFVEVKHTTLEPRDVKKYLKFHTCIEDKCQNARVRFVVISSHTRRGLRHLHDSKWEDLRSGLGETQHILLQEIHDEMVTLRKSRRVGSSDNVLRVFEIYLALILGTHQDETILTRLWDDIVDDYCEYGKRLFIKSLKEEVVEHVKWLATINGITGGQWRQDVEGLRIIVLDRNENRKTCRMGGRVDRLDVEVDGEAKPFVFELNEKPNISSIVSNIVAISSLVTGGT